MSRVSANMAPVVPPPVAVTTPPAAPGPVNVPGLPPPVHDADMPSDPLGMLMTLMARIANLSVEESTAKVMANREKLQEAMEEFRAKMEEIARKAEEQRKEADDGWGILGDICDAVCDTVGKLVGDILGPVMDKVVDVIRAPIDIVAGLIKGGNLADLLEQEVSDLKTEGKLSETVKEAAKGVSAFVRDIYNATTGLLEDLASGKNPIEALKDFGADCWNSLCTNIVDNPAVMEVLGTVMQVVAVAGAVASGGVLGIVAAGLIALSMVDKHTGLCNEVFGEKAGPWVSLGIGVAGAVLGGLSTMDMSKLAELDPSALQGMVSDMKSVLTVTNGVLTAVATYRGAQQLLRDAERLDDFADVKELMNRMAEIQRMIDALLAEVEERSESRGRVMQGAAKVTQLQGEGLQTAVSLRA